MCLRADEAHTIPQWSGDENRSKSDLLLDEFVRRPTQQDETGELDDDLFGFRKPIVHKISLPSAERDPCERARNLLTDAPAEDSRGLRLRI
jgi:hypothetical protein